MESNNAPAHDFAPAWLKIPSFNKTTTAVSSVEKSLNQDNFSFRPQYLKKDNKTKDSANNYSVNSTSSTSNTSSTSTTSSSSTSSSSNNSGGSSSNNSSESSHQDSKEQKSSNTSGRHNSGDLDSPPDSLKHQTGTIGNLNRRYQKIKWENQRRPHSRHDFRDITSFHHSKSGHNYGSEGKSSSSDQSAIEEAKNSSNKASNTSKSGIVDSNTFNQEFPSLVDEKSTSVISNGNSVWDNAKNKVLSTVSRKVTILPRPVCSSENLEDKPSDGINGGSLYYRFVPGSKKRTSSANSKEAVGLISSLGHSAKIMPVLTKSSLQTTSPAMKTLVKNPKKRSNKNEFLKTLRAVDTSGKECDKSNDNSLIEDSSKQLDDEKNNEEVDTKATSNSSSTCEECEQGIQIAKLVVNDEFDDNNMELSSSLEAERRLLREMGWKEEDDEDDNYYAPLTEDEVKEFKDLIVQRNGFKRHTNLNHIQINWSPKKANTTTTTTTTTTTSNKAATTTTNTPFRCNTSPIDVDEETSSSSDDEDDEADL